MIPKVIHYCWFGGNPMSSKIKEYIETWKKFCPDYKIMEWNESNFNVNKNAYCKEAYEAKKWAFVTDYVRIYVLEKMGGVYLDTDVEICKNLDSLLTYNAFMGIETEDRISTGVIGCAPGCDWMRSILKAYKGRHFLQENGKYDFMTNVEFISKLTQDKYKVILDNNKVIFGDNYLILPFEYLCAKSWYTREVCKTHNTYAIHHFDGSWLPAKDKRLSMLKERYLARYSAYLPIYVAIKLSGMHARAVNHFLKKRKN